MVRDRNRTPPVFADEPKERIMTIAQRVAATRFEPRPEKPIRVPRRMAARAQVVREHQPRITD